ncbi:MAG: hypothetical protein BJ554DRAFT_4273 [Olpidium bornovanus]|uniref:Uncharacterized protein n=1 Tax=Olpidium bornovanus TaxID=278681 RepID=A0A8H8A083_9FUNG|nr:MAG: hypothetical protein BJ554DRAFT_4273 [Olpidium bornovanus]
MPVGSAASLAAAAASGCAKRQQPLAAAVRGSRGSDLLRRLLPPQTTPLSRAAKDMISRNHRYHYIFHENEVFHNHLAHHVVAVQALGCEDFGACRFDDLWAAYDSYLPKKPRRRTDVNINDANWRNWLGDHRCSKDGRSVRFLVSARGKAVSPRRHYF